MDVVADAVLRSRAGLAASQRGSSFLFLVTARHLSSPAPVVFQHVSLCTSLADDVVRMTWLE